MNQRVLQPRLWLEALNGDFDAVAIGLGQGWQEAVLRHAISKSKDMSIPLLADRRLLNLMTRLARSMRVGEVQLTTERMLLRPSNGVVEASDYLSTRHDWVQIHEEITEPLPRAMFVPWSQPASNGPSPSGRCKVLV